MKCLLISLVICGTFFSSYAQNGCNSCRGNTEWKAKREIVSGRHETPPYNAIIRINTKRIYNFFSDHYGTASFINDSTIITAKHNLLR